MSASPRRPRSIAGSFVVGPDATVIEFQYNPEQVSRNIEPQMVGGDGHRSGAVRFVGAPNETIEMQLRLDAVDGLEAADPPTLQYGVAARLARLELLAFPDLDAVTHREQLLSTGAIEIIPDAAPLILLVLGKNRSMPVRLQRLAVVEQAFDQQLNPIRATVDVTLHVLTYSDVLKSNEAYGHFVSYQRALLAQAAAAPAGGAG